MRMLNMAQCVSVECLDKKPFDRFVKYFEEKPKKLFRSGTKAGYYIAPMVLGIYHGWAGPFTPQEVCDKLETSNLLFEKNAVYQMPCVKLKFNDGVGHIEYFESYDKAKIRMKILSIEVEYKKCIFVE